MELLHWCICLFSFSEGGVDPAAHGAKQEDRFYNNKSFQKPDVDPSDPSQQDAALKIQTKYRQHHAKKVGCICFVLFFSKADTTVQSMWKACKLNKDICK